MENIKILTKNINYNAIKICEILQNSNFQSFIVGGCVRDLILGITPKDWDICTDASPEQVMQLFPKHYPTGLQHGTITVAMGEGSENHFEITTFRTEGEYLDGRRPESVVFVKDIVQDLARRDLTINAMAFNPISEQLIDPFDGISDIKNKIIKAVGNADDRFKEDGLRIMRVARFAARFGYEIENKTFQGMASNLETLKKISKERIKDELCKILLTKHAFYGLNVLKDLKILNIICPSIKYDINFPMDINLCSGDLETKVALLYYCSNLEEIELDLINLKFSNKEIKRIIFQLKLLKTSFKHFNKTAYIEFISFIKNNAPDPWEYTLNQFITLTVAGGLDITSHLNQFKNIKVFSKKELQIDGNDLISFGIKPGPDIKKILDKCYSEVLQNSENNNKDYLFKFAAFNTKNRV